VPKEAAKGGYGLFSSSKAELSPKKTMPLPPFETPNTPLGVPFASPTEATSLRLSSEFPYRFYPSVHPPKWIVPDLLFRLYTKRSPLKTVCFTKPLNHLSSS
jgi:hypothetical protein